ncbi:unnamed protein product [Phyllotreta striolata]|uniref:THAP-type domain-containing protein n=1 Tax=Phyllotreta striolata TaxID=444603 RepID=A0A9N9TMX9_PHYSR|nr:unnamed protein product [Phyllotreta striolata]
MTKKCFLCGERWKSNESSTFHALPTSKETRKKWLDSLQWNEPLEPHKQYFVCSRHFAKDDLVNNNLDPFSKTRIRRGVIPTILNPRSADCHNTVKDEETSSSVEDSTSTDTDSTVTATSVSESDSPLIPCRCTAVTLSLNKTSSTAVDNLKTNDSERTARTSTSSKSESTSISNVYFRKFVFGNRRVNERLKYFGDFNVQSLNTESRRRKFFEISNRTILDLRKKNKLLQAQVRRLKKSVRRETTGVKPEYITVIDENTPIDCLEPSEPSPSEAQNGNSDCNNRDHDYAIGPVDSVETIRIVVCPD